tara:strand:+ start:5313 stop:6356 length:1044 start_codon:yes stop_codon:yes gene_type:complete
MKFLFSLLASLTSTILVADEVKTSDGSVIQGVIIGMDDGNLSIKTAFAGVLKISEDQISSLSSEKKIMIRLDDNRTFNGQVLSQEEGRFSLSEQPEVFAFPVVQHLWPEEADDPLILEVKKKAEAMLMQWKHSLGFDLTGASGNTESFGLGIRLDSGLGNKIRGYDFYLSYNNSTKKNTTIEDETKLGVEYDSRFYESLAWYAKSDFENDRLENVDLRATAALGLKYSWIDKKNYRVSARTGAAFRFEKLNTSDKDGINDPAIDLGLEYSQQIKDSLSLESDISFVPSFNDFSDYLVSKDTALIFPLDRKLNWNLRSGLSGTYNSTPLTKNEELDLKYYLRLVYMFK